MWPTSSINVQIASTTRSMMAGVYLAAGSGVGWLIHPAVPVIAGAGIILWYGRQTLILTGLRRRADAAYEAQARDAERSSPH